MLTGCYTEGAIVKCEKLESASIVRPKILWKGTENN
jgi:hypothetical protein